MVFHHFDRFIAAYEVRFEREYGYLRPVVREVVDRDFDCGIPCSGFARIRCPAACACLVPIILTNTGNPGLLLIKQTTSRAQPKMLIDNSCLLLCNTGNNKGRVH